MATKKDMAEILNGLEASTALEHEAKVAKTVKKRKAAPKAARATALVSMTADEKEHLTTVARAHGLSLSAFLRLSANEYIKTHDWDL